MQRRCVTRFLIERPGFGRLWLAGLVSGLGDQLLFLALPFFVYQATGSAAATGMILVAQTMPRALAGSVAGVFADRWSRRRIMVAADAFRGILLLTLLVPRLRDSLGVVYAVLFVQSSAGQLFGPAKGALIPHLVEEGDLATANAANALEDNLTILVGPVLGGAIYAVLGLGSVVALDVASFLISAVLIKSIAVSSTAALGTTERPGPSHNITRSLAGAWLDGVDLVRRDRVFAALVVVVGVTMLGNGLVSALLVPWTREILKVGPTQFGWIITAQSLGGILAGLLVGKVAVRVPPLRLVAASATLAGLSFLTGLNGRSLVLALLSTPILGAAVVGFGVGSQTFIQYRLSDAIRGRAFGLVGSIGNLGMVAGGGLATIAGDHLGLLPTMNVGCALICASGLIALYRSRPHLPHPLTPSPAPLARGEADARARSGSPSPSPMVRGPGGEARHRIRRQPHSVDPSPF